MPHDFEPRAFGPIPNDGAQVQEPGRYTQPPGNGAGGERRRETATSRTLAVSGNGGLAIP
jgi:hypothetical protein